jgi:hypothetical protein
MQEQKKEWIDILISIDPKFADKKVFNETYDYCMMFINTFHDEDTNIYISELKRNLMRTYQLTDDNLQMFIDVYKTYIIQTQQSATEPKNNKNDLHYDMTKSNKCTSLPISDIKYVDGILIRGDKKLTEFVELCVSINPILSNEAIFSTMLDCVRKLINYNKYKNVGICQIGQNRITEEIEKLFSILRSNGIKEQDFNDFLMIYKSLMEEYFDKKKKPIDIIPVNPSTHRINSSLKYNKNKGIISMNNFVPDDFFIKSISSFTTTGITNNYWINLLNFETKIFDLLDMMTENLTMSSKPTNKNCSYVPYKTDILSVVEYISSIQQTPFMKNTYENIVTHFTTFCKRKLKLLDQKGFELNKLEIIKKNQNKITELSFDRIIIDSKSQYVDKYGITLPILRMVFTTMNGIDKFLDISNCDQQLPYDWIHQDMYLQKRKKTNSIDLENYELIPYFPICVKIFHQYISGKLYEHLVNNDYLDQSIHYLFKIDNGWDNLDKFNEELKSLRHSDSKIGLMTLININDPYSSISHQFIHFVMESFKVPLYIKKYIYSYYENLMLRIIGSNENNSEENYFRMERGILNEDNLSDVLYIMCISYILQHLNRQYGKFNNFNEKLVPNIIKLYGSNVVLFSQDKQIAKRVLFDFIKINRLLRTGFVVSLEETFNILFNLTSNDPITINLDGKMYTIVDQSTNLIRCPSTSYCEYEIESKDQMINRLISELKIAETQLTTLGFFNGIMNGSTPIDPEKSQSVRHKILEHITAKFFHQLGQSIICDFSSFYEKIRDILESYKIRWKIYKNIFKYESSCDNKFDCKIDKIQYVDLEINNYILAFLNQYDEKFIKSIKNMLHDQKFCGSLSVNSFDKYFRSSDIFFKSYST